MRIVRPAVVVLLVAAATSTVFTQASPQSSPPGPTFEVVSIKLVTEARPTGQSLTQRPDGGITMTNIPVATVIGRAYPFATPGSMVGLPEWARRDGYDVSATSSVSSPTPDQRTAMLRAMLADRFKLVVHIESREQPIYDLVLARRDGRLGSGLTPLNVDCARMAAERAAAVAPPPQRPDFNVPPPQCTARVIDVMMRDRYGDKQGRLGDLLEGELTMDDLAANLRNSGTDRVVVNKTGLPGSYRVRMNFDMRAARRGPEITPTPDSPPSVFTAVQEQLGLKLEPSTAPRDTLIIDRLERPSEN